MIDYEAIAREVCSVHRLSALTDAHIRTAIDAYERQKAAPEWVPLDLEMVQQGLEVRHKEWADSDAQTFVCAYKSPGLITEARNGTLHKQFNAGSWLMRAPKPKTVRVRVFKHHSGYSYWAAAVTGQLNSDGQSPVGEGDIEVRE